MAARVMHTASIVADNPTGANYFHLAEAHRAANNAKAAREDLREAVKLGLKEKDLHPFERAQFQKLLADPALLERSGKLSPPHAG